MRKAIYAGSFDVIHNGHVWMVQEGSRLFDEIVVLISVNADKNHFISFDDRLRLAKAIFEPLGKNIQVVGLEKEFVVNYATRNGAQYLLRGIRSNLDYEYEANIANINHDLAEDKSINSVFLMPPPTLKSMSSSMVRGLIGYNGWEHAVEQYVPELMAEELYYLHSSNANLRIDYLLRKYEVAMTSQELMALYEGRPYHNWHHIEECIEQFMRVRSQFKKPDVVEMALYFHDAIYDVTKNDSEDQSASLFIEKMGSLNFDFRWAVEKFIKRTKWVGNEYPLTMSDEEKLLHDIDFSIFSADWERFLEYDESIAKEYAGYAPEDIFKKGRRDFLSGFRRIFETPYFNEDKAKANVGKILRERY